MKSAPMWVWTTQQLLETGSAPLRRPSFLSFLTLPLPAWLILLEAFSSHVDVPPLSFHAIQFPFVTIVECSWAFHLIGDQYQHHYQ